MPDTAIVENNSHINQKPSLNTKNFTSIGDLLKQSWEMVKLSWKNLFLLNLIAVVITGVLALIMGVAVFGTFGFNIVNAAEIFSGATTLALIITVIICLVIVAIYTMLGISMMFAVAEAEQKPSIGSLVSKGLNLFLPVFLTSLIVAFLAYGGSFLFIIPGLIMAILMSLASYESIFTENKYMTAIKNSISIVSQNFGELFIRVLVIIGLFIALVVIESVLTSIVGKDSPAASLIGLVASIAQAVLTWIVIAYYYLVYKEARAMTDFNRKSSMVWMWIVSIIGWIVGAFLIVGMFAAIKGILEKAYGDTDYSGSEMMENNQVIDTETGDVDVDTEKLLEEYGQEMSDEEKAMFRQMINQTESNIQQDDKTAVEETQQ